MAKLYASEAAQAVAVEAMKIEGVRGQLASGLIERLYRDAPLMIIGEGTNEIQRLIICRNLLERYGERPGALTSREGEPGRAETARAGGAAGSSRRTSCRSRPSRTRAGAIPRLWWRSSPSSASSAPWPAPSTAGSACRSPPRPCSWRKLARGWAALAIWLAAQLAATLAVARSVPRDARERLLPPMTRGERWTAVAGGRHPSGRAARARTGSSPGLRRWCRTRAGPSCSWSTPRWRTAGARVLHGRVGPGRPDRGPRVRHRRPARPRRGGRGPGRRAPRRPGGAPRRRRDAARGRHQCGRRRHRGGAGPGRLRGGAALLPAAVHLRQADLPAPGGAAQAGRHGDRDHRGAPPDRARGRAPRRRRARRRGRRRWPAVAAGDDRRHGHARVHAHPRGLRVHERVPCRALLPRRGRACWSGRATRRASGARLAARRLEAP